MRKVLERRPQRLLVVAPRDGQRIAIEILENRVVLAQEALDAKQIAVDLDVAKVPGVLENGKLSICGPHREGRSTDALDEGAQTLRRGGQFDPDLLELSGSHVMRPFR